jgi:hypothetical protein
MMRRIYRIYGGNLRTIRWDETDWETSIPLREWAAKYNYSEKGAYSLIEDGRIIARKNKGRWFLLDSPPRNRPISVF